PTHALSLFSIEGPGHTRALHSFPTRRSSDLVGEGARCHIHRRANTRARVRSDLAAHAAHSRDVPHHPARNAGVDEAWYDSDQCQDRKSTRLNSSHLGISYAVFCLKKKKTIHI